MLQNLIKSKTRVRLLVKFFTNIANKGYLNSLAEEFGESTNSIRKELNNLASAGYLKKHSENNKIIYRANDKHPLFNTLQQIVFNHLGLEEIIQNVLEKSGNIDKIYLLGDYAKGIDSGIIEILIVGNNINIKYLNGLVPTIEKKINRKLFFLFSDRPPFRGNELLIFEVS